MLPKPEPEQPNNPADSCDTCTRRECGECAENEGAYDKATADAIEAAMYLELITNAALLRVAAHAGARYRQRLLTKIFSKN